ncbi:MAG: trypsin-like peptidase domain-containing protein [bacterium]|nr:trypsin-like peptidase domain-containing protein [bacterium]
MIFLLAALGPHGCTILRAMGNWRGFEAGVVRIQDGPGPGAETLGAGFLVEERRILTCAHVVGQRHDGHYQTLYVAFVPEPGKPREATVLHCGNPKGRADDIAVLELVETRPSSSNSLALTGHEPGDTFHAVGFDRPSGTAIEGSVLALLPGGWVQIETKGARHVERYFSGTAVWSQRRGGALGMIVAKEATDAAYMIPTSGLWQVLRFASLASVSPWLVDALPRLTRICVQMGLKSEEIRQLHQSCAPRDWPALSLTAEPEKLLKDAVQSLAEAPQQSSSGAFPLLRFVRSLRGRVRDALRQELEEWLEEARRDFGELVPAVVTQAPEAQPGPYYVLVKIEAPCSEEVGPKTRCHIGAYLLGSPRPANLLDEESTLESERAGANLHRILRKAIKRITAITDEGFDPRSIQFEFLLPEALLVLDVDQWFLRLPFEKVRVGTHQLVVVRSLERDTDPILRALLRARWEELHREPEFSCRRLLLDDLSVEDRATAVCFSVSRTERSLHAALSSTKVVCATLLWAPTAPDRTLRGLLQDGVPAALWLRKKGILSAEGGYSFFRQLIENKPLNRLPAKIRQVRVDAANEADEHEGRHLTLLWDDPTRPFPDRTEDGAFYEPELLEDP